MDEGDKMRQRYTTFEHAVEREMIRRRARGWVRALYWLVGLVVFTVLLLTCAFLGVMAS